MVNLTRRQWEVIALAAEGLGDKEIAAILGSSPATVQKHMSNILARLNAGNRLGAVVTCLRSRCPMPNPACLPIMKEGERIR